MHPWLIFISIYWQRCQKTVSSSGLLFGFISYLMYIIKQDSWYWNSFVLMSVPSILLIWSKFFILEAHLFSMFFEVFFAHKSVHLTSIFFLLLPQNKYSSIGKSICMTLMLMSYLLMESQAVFFSSWFSLTKFTGFFFFITWAIFVKVW